MSSEWKDVELGDVIELKRGYDLPKAKRKKGLIPIVSSSGISGQHVISKVSGPGVVTGRYGTIGEVYYVEKNFWPLNTTLYVRDFKGNNPRFISYFLKTLNFKAYSDKAAVPGVNRNHLHKAKIYFPTDISTQRNITNILQSLDDKIDLNQRMNKTLEEMAQALFKCWFVDFEPTRAKMAGESPDSICQRLNLTPDILRLFPDSLTDSSLGPIPDGWSQESLSVFCNLNPTSWTKRNAPERVEYVDLANTKWGAINSTEKYAFISAPSRARRILHVGDTVVGTVRPGNGSYAWIGKNGLTGSTGFAVLRPKEEHFSEFVYLATTYIENIEHLAHLADGGAYPAVRPEIVLATRCLKPTDGLIREFSSVVKPFFKRRETNSTATKTLAQIRDTLLPKLLSGELPVGKIDENMEGNKV